MLLISLKGMAVFRSITNINMRSLGQPLYGSRASPAPGATDVQRARSSEGQNIQTIFFRPYVRLRFPMAGLLEQICRFVA